MITVSHKMQLRINFHKIYEDIFNNDAYVSESIALGFKTVHETY